MLPNGPSRAQTAKSSQCRSLLLLFCPGDHLSPILQVRMQWKLNVIRPFSWLKTAHARQDSPTFVCVSSSEDETYGLALTTLGDPRKAHWMKANLKGRAFSFKGEHALSLPFVCQKISYISALAQAAFVPSWIMRRWSRTRPPQFHVKNAESPIAHRPTQGQSRELTSVLTSPLCNCLSQVHHFSTLFAAIAFTLVAMSSDLSHLHSLIVGQAFIVADGHPFAGSQHEAHVRRLLNFPQLFWQHSFGIQFMRRSPTIFALLDK
ncbi:hypothetical protein SCHPADRAFT_6044 [Schizopora paradoxa]|uniref:Uncharacterized protein n=1 Tax=Schizopora paradoxa TaxID=27342 RepID=A0A0H2S885_9AGAM|nr:hypothetical protein SCHPADRAFT_6044 [Schizopora paradoxa]